MSPILVVVITSVFVAYLIYYTRSHRQRLAARRQANALPQLSSVGMAGGGAAPLVEGSAVRVIGTTRAVQPLTSPISGQPCVAWRVRVTVDRYVAPEAAPINQTQTMEFFIDRPGEPSVTIDGAYVRLDVPPETRETYDGARAEQFFQQHGLPIRAVLGSEIEETIVRVGARVMVAGSVLLDGAAAAPSGGYLHTGAGATASHAYRSDGAPAIRLAGNAQQPLVIASVR